MKRKYVLLKGTLTLTLTGLISRIIGFFYRIFLSNTIGAEGMGIYQLIFPVYILCFSLTVMGIQTAVSRFTSAKMASEDKSAACNILYTGLLISVIPAILVSGVVYLNADSIAVLFLKEVRCAPLLRIMCFAIPFGAIHSCINGYYYGIKKASIPALSQLIEQVVRVLGVYLIYLIYLEKGIKTGVTIAAIGLVIGEAASVLYTVTCYASESRKYINKLSIPGIYIAKLATLSFPLTANRVTVTLMQSYEAVLIPARLKLSGMATTEALSIYGVLTGMSLPLILFPSAITNSLSVMLLPDVAEAQASNNTEHVKFTISSTVKYCLLLGILCTGIFLTFGNKMGNLMFHNALAGSFIVTLAWICPFLYLGTTLSSILNGLGKTFLTFMQNMIALAIRILFVIFLVPRFGIQAYLWGLLLSQLVITLLSLHSLNRYAKIQIPIQLWLIKPVCAIFIAIAFSLYGNVLLDRLHAFPNVLNIVLCSFLLCIIYLALLSFWGVFNELFRLQNRAMKKYLSRT